MTLSTQDYADLSQATYRPPKKDSNGNYTPETINGIKYQPLEYMENKTTGYQGTIYQRVDTGEIIVAHRGTEPPLTDKDPNAKDALTDAAMVFKRTNAQVPDAEKLTQHALEKAKRYAEENYTSIPEVTVTGHSLGGTLTQITASKFHLHGETFNAYGAASLQLDDGRRLPVGGHAVINHVMAADAVSAASAHFGQVRMYASQKEVQTIAALGYTNDHSPLDPFVNAATPLFLRATRPVATAASNLGSHSISNFANTDDQGHPSASILADPQAQQRAAHNAGMLEHYRADVHIARVTISLLGNAALVPSQTAERAYDHASEAAARASEAMAQSYAQARKTVSEHVDAASNKASQMADDAVRHLERSALDGALGLSNTLDQTFGRAGHAAVQGAQAVERGIDAVGNKASQMAGDAARRLEKSTLDGALDLSNTLDQAFDRVGLGQSGAETRADPPADRSQARLRYLEVGNIPVPPTFFTVPETTPPSSLMPVHRQERPDRMHELTLLREITLVNDRTAWELTQTPVQRSLELSPRMAPVQLQSEASKQASAPATGYDPREPDHRDHALYTELHRRIPQASEDRLAQFTAACHVNGITNKNLGQIYPFEEAGQIWFGSTSPVGPTFAKVDMTQPMPTQQQLHQQVQSYDQQQQTIEQSRFQARQAEMSQQQQGPVLGAPMR